MATKKPVKKSTKKTPTKKKATKRTVKSKQYTGSSLVPPAIPRHEGSPTSETELRALFEPHDTNEQPKEKITPVKTSRKKKRLWKYVALLLVFFVGGSYLWLKSRLNQSIVPEEGSAIVKGVTANITISRDDYGVPHIKAENLEDLAFGAGFAMASDRNFQLEFLRRMALGELSEVLGKDALGLDIFMRSLGFRALTERNYQTLSPKLRGVLDAYAKGINAQREAFPKREIEFMLLGLTPAKWKPQDSLALYQLFSFLLATNLTEELGFLKFAARFGAEKAAYLFPVYPDENLPFSEATHLKNIDWTKIVAIDGTKSASNADFNPPFDWKMLLPEPALPASNNWAVSPKRTQSGKTLLANDTHLQLTVPAMWYMMNLECPEYRAAGVALPGTPIVALGTNGTIAWGATMVMADNQDIFLEQMREQDGKKQYLYKGKWLDAKIEEQKIKIKGGAEHTFKRITTRHGVLVNEALLYTFPDKYLSINFKSEYGLAFSTTVGSKETTLQGIFDMASARTMKQARTALDKVTGIYLNIVYADAKNIAHVATGKYPVRKGVTGQLPRIGWTGEDDWDGYFLPSENPSSINPKEGYIATANNRIWGPDADTDLWISASWYSPDRADRAKELLSQKKYLTQEDMERFQADTVSISAKETKEYLLKSVFSAKLNSAIQQLPEKDRERAKEALQFFEKFDGNLSKSSAAAAVYENFASSVALLTFADEMDGHTSALWTNFQAINKRSYSAVHDHILGREESPFWDNIATNEKETKASILAAALAKSIVLSEDSMGKNRANWAWGKIHQYHWKHPFSLKASFLKGYLNRGPVDAGGDMHTLNQAGNLWGDAHDVWLIPAMRFIVDFSREDGAELIIHMGLSGNPSSQHYADMIPLFTEVKYSPLPLKSKSVLKQYSRHFVLIKE
ncbi:MAG: Acyl-homoserine lactone acylase QuiP [Turneriella sp.]|nr:Acyl-homoserine lactone acylase QuiP [Turneriella sp.]